MARECPDSLNGPTVKDSDTYAPALAAQNEKPALATNSAPVCTEQDKLDEPGSIACVMHKPRRPPIQTGMLRW